MLKFSGEVLRGHGADSIDFKILEGLAGEIKGIKEMKDIKYLPDDEQPIMYA